MTREEELKKIKDELHALYQKALTKEEYKKAVALTDKCSVTLRASRESPDTIVETILDGLWSEYYLLLKFPEMIKDKAVENNRNFMVKVEELIRRVVEPANKAELLYLVSAVWSHLLNDQENAEWCNRDLQKLISYGKVSVALILKGINSRVIKEMDAKNWQGAIKIADEINQFSKEVIEQPENIGAAANIINNRGASKIRGDIDIKDGIKDLVTALDYYLKQTPVQMKHIEGIRNRLTEAIKKM